MLVKFEPVPLRAAFIYNRCLKGLADLKAARQLDGQLVILMRKSEIFRVALYRFDGHIIGKIKRDAVERGPRGDGAHCNASGNLFGWRVYPDAKLVMLHIEAGVIYFLRPGP